MMSKDTAMTTTPTTATATTTATKEKTQGPPPLAAMQSQHTAKKAIASQTSSFVSATATTRTANSESAGSSTAAPIKTLDFNKQHQRQQFLLTSTHSIRSTESSIRTNRTTQSYYNNGINGINGNNNGINGINGNGNSNSNNNGNGILVNNNNNHITKDSIRAFLVDYFEDWNTLAGKSDECWKSFFHQHHNVHQYQLVLANGTIQDLSQVIAEYTSKDMKLRHVSLVQIDSITPGGIVVYTVDFVYTKYNMDESSRVLITGFVQEHMGTLQFLHEHRCAGRPIPTEPRWCATLASPTLSVGGSSHHSHSHNSKATSTTAVGTDAASLLPPPPPPPTTAVYISPKASLSPNMAPRKHHGHPPLANSNHNSNHNNTTTSPKPLSSSSHHSTSSRQRLRGSNHSSRVLSPRVLSPRVLSPRKLPATLLEDSIQLLPTTNMEDNDIDDSDEEILIAYNDVSSTTKRKPMMRRVESSGSRFDTVLERVDSDHQIYPPQRGMHSVASDTSLMLPKRQCSFRAKGNAEWGSSSTATTTSTTNDAKTADNNDNTAATKMRARILELARTRGSNSNIATAASIFDKPNLLNAFMASSPALGTTSYQNKRSQVMANQNFASLISKPAKLSSKTKQSILQDMLSSPSSVKTAPTKLHQSAAINEALSLTKSNHSSQRKNALNRSGHDSASRFHAGSGLQMTPPHRSVSTESNPIAANLKSIGPLPIAAGSPPKLNDDDTSIKNMSLDGANMFLDKTRDGPVFIAPIEGDDSSHDNSRSNHDLFPNKPQRKQSMEM